MVDWVKNKNLYRKFCQQHPELPIFLSDYWLDAVCERGSWQVCLSINGDSNIQGVLPFYFTKQFGIKVIVMPPLTPFLGAWLKYPENLEKEVLIISFEKKCSKI